MLKETLHIEFKPNFNEDVIETLVAFANAKGGKTLVGVDDKGKPLKNFTIGKESVQKWLNEIKTKTQPQIIPDWEIVDYKGSEIVEFSIQEYPIKPVSTRGKYYKRIGNANHLLSAGEVANMHLQTVNSSWDYYPRPNKTLADISLAKVEKAMKIMRKRNDSFEFETPVEFLSKNELLLPDNRVTNGCFLMFSEGENLYTTIQMGHFQNEITIKDDVVNSDDILTQIDEVMQFVKKHISKELIITDTQIENIQRWQYPLDAIREIVLNMIIHRDYTSSYNSIIKIFSDHIQFYNPGNLPDTISIEQLRTNEYISKPRNRQIAKTIKEMGWIERYGTGIKRVRRMFVEYGLTEPIFKEETDGMLVTVFGLSFDENTRKFEDREIDEGGAIGGAIGGAMEEILTDRQIEILNIIKNNPSISYRVLSKQLNINESAVLKHLDSLKKKGLIEREGKTRGYWKIND
jgi:ATP-dependent DNA helicase RecG